MTLKVTWAGSPNFSPGRDGHNPDWTEADPNSWIVLHTMVGTFAAANARFQNPAQQASANYGVLLDGSIVQWVTEADAAWANGTYADNPGSNLDSISIEHEDNGDYNGPRTPALYEASAQLLADIHRRTGIPLMHRGAGGGVLGHKECQGAVTACPDGLDLARIIARANEILNPPQPPQPPPQPPQPPQPPPPPRPPPTPEPTPQPSPATHDEDVPAPARFDLVKAIPLIDMATGQTIKLVGPGALETAYVRQVGDTLYAVTQYSHDSRENTGFRSADIQAAIAPPPAPPPEPPQTAPASWEEWLVDLADREIVALIEYLRSHLEKRGQQ